MRIRGFEKVGIEIFKKNSGIEFSDETYEKIVMPTRKTVNSAGYDIVCPYQVILKPKEERIIYTGLKAYMLADEFLSIYIRSSTAVKKHLILVNVVGIIDADYYNNIGNEGHIMLVVKNISDQIIEIAQNERIAQAIFQKYLRVSSELDDHQEVTTKRIGGIGSTDN